MSAAVRALAMDAVEQAKNGHPGAPMGMADFATVLWRGHLRHNPNNPSWANRDRFVLSNGHASVLLYALLHLTGYDLPIGELKRLRQLHSKTPGHPEVGLTPGVETTTGPLGQGIANAVGMAIAERTLAAQFNRPGHEIVDHRTYAFVGDGCLMEGISHEVASLAGTIGLGKLTVIYDDNGISIDGKVKEWFGDDTPARFEAYGWNVIRGVDGHDPSAVDAAITAAAAQSAKPTLICAKTIIGFGAPTKAGTEGAHGAALGAAEIAGARAAMHWPYPPFEVPAEIYAAWDCKQAGGALEDAWNVKFAAYKAAYPELAAEFLRRMAGELPAGFETWAEAALAETQAQTEVIATRKASQNALNLLAPKLPEFLGGSADLTHSNLTNYKGTLPITRDPAGNTVLFGVREFGMTAIANGISLHGGFLPFVATFLVFSDYARNAVRMSALMHRRLVHVYTHDSIGVGEDGPTHQPVEHVESLRVIPNLDVWRPCDPAETFAAWTAAVSRKDGPSALALSRQGLPVQPRSPEQLKAIFKGGYVLSEPATAPKVVLIGTGSELKFAVEAAAKLAEEGIAARVVSMPCTDRFDRQDKAYRASVIPANIPAVAVEAGVTRGWFKYVGLSGAVVGVDRFGESAPEKDVYTYLGITTAHVVEVAKSVI
ncbi:MAG: transketolase [Ancalomicrobiaceae bacterium]|nr:transketolase [Ancalomicrobiaceae bacterium]